MRTALKPRPARVMAAVGPGDVVMAFEDWKSGASTLSETSVPFSVLEFEALEAAGSPYWAVSRHPRRALVERQGNRVENLPRDVGAPASGWRYHAQLLTYAVRLLARARRLRATHAVVDTGTTHWFALLPFRWFGIAVIPNWHNVYWPVGYPPQSTAHRTILKLDRWFFRHCVRAAIGCSPECGRQIADLSGGGARYFDYRAQFYPQDFQSMPRPAWSPTTLRVLFASRVERDKGVFDILTIAEQLAAQRPGRFTFDVCGVGGASEALAHEVAARGLGEVVKLHGKLLRPDLVRVYAASHVVIVPTRSDFCEGLPMVCAEAVLSHRPVVTSRLSNALEALQGAVLEAQPDDAASYSAQLLRLAEDPALYESLVRATDGLGGQFIDRERGIGAALTAALEAG